MLQVLAHSPESACVSLTCLQGHVKNDNVCAQLYYSLYLYVGMATQAVHNACRHSTGVACWPHVQQLQQRIVGTGFVAGDLAPAASLSLRTGGQI